MAKRTPKEIVSDAQQDAMHVDIAKAKSEAAKWRKRYNEAVSLSSSLESQVETLLAIQGKPAIKRFESSIRNKARGAAIVIPATDWHIEEQVNRAATNGKNEYNLIEAERRIKKFYINAIKLVDWYRHLAPVNELWHSLLGDLITGYIHEELMESNALSPTEAILFAQDFIYSGIHKLIKETKLGISIPCCIGNHGRTTQRIHIKTGCRNSYEWMMYKNLERMFAGDRRVRFYVPTGYHNIQTIAGRLVRFHHGDGMRYYGGVGGISIPVNKAVAQWDKVKTVDFDIFGHWHQFLDGYPKWISCGSLMGFTEYCISIKAEFQHPTQTFIAIDKNKGLTMAIPIFLT